MRLARRHLLRLLPAALAGLAPPGTRQAPAFRTRVDAVRLDVLVLDGGRPVPKLTAADFEVSDTGVRQSIHVERIADLPLDVVLVVDISSSVEGELLRQLMESARALIDALHPDDRAALVAFSHLVTPIARLETPRAQLAAAINRLEAAGNTSVVDAVSVALTLATRQRPTLMLLFSDGYDTASWLTPGQVLEQARRTDVVVDAVVVGDLRPGQRAAAGARDRPDQFDDVEDFLHDVTALTGGRQFDGAHGARLSERFGEALALFRERYQISFTSTVDRPGWHPVDVRVPRRRGLTIRARAGYWR
jgi:VWFA-related protein